MSRFLKSPVTRAAIIAYALLAASFAVLVQTPTASAQGGSTELVLGLQNDMTSLNFWNPETNTVWNFYQVGWSFETLFSSDPASAFYPVLANPALGDEAPGYDIRLDLDATGLTVDVFIRQGVTFHDGQPMDADDVVFSYQTKAWSTESTLINNALWHATATFPHWSGTGFSHIGVTKISQYVVRFVLAQPYALFFFGTLGGATIIPRHIWEAHMLTTPPADFLDPTQTVTSADRSIDMGYGAAGQLDSTIGTGMFMLESWVRQAGSRIVAYEGYWGKGLSHTWAGTAYPFFPEHIRSIRFIIFSSLDVISLALQRGDIDSLIWSLTPGFLSQVRFNPAISVEQVTDRGFFYISFNLRRSPWNDLDLREAISMAIDKDYIVNTLMGGFGIKGAQPLSIHNPAYVNASALPPSFDLAGAAALLDSAGIVDVDGDGFREYKDGSPIRTSILTPPKDYDPVRADAGIMISNNLKRIGLNIDAAPTSFDTIVSKAFTEVDFDIYVLGFLLGDFPELYLCDFFCSRNDVAINPAGSNSAGYRNPTVDSLLAQADITIDTTARQQILKDAQGIITADLPWNILYYRKNLNAYRNDRWVGWVNTPPQIYNFWSLSKLRPAGVVTVPPPSGALSVAMTVPERAIGGRTVPVDVFVSRNLRPVLGATVWVNATFGSQLRSMTGTTDVGGHVRLTWTVPVIQGNLLLTATAASAGSLGTASKLLQVTVGPPAPMATLSVSTSTPVIGPAGTSSIVAKVADGAGVGIQGASVRVDTTLVLGSITPASGVTGSAGTLTFTYTAPADASLFPNQHLTEFLKFNTSVLETVAVDTQLASLIQYVENDDAPAWYQADVDGTPDLVLNLIVPGQDTTTVDVMVTNFAGVAQANVDVDAQLPAGNWNLTVTPATATTDATGIATFTLTATASAKTDLNITNVAVRFRPAGSAFQTSDVAGVLLTDGVAPGHAALIDFTDRSITSAPQQNTTVSATIWDQLGGAAADGAVIFQIVKGDIGLPAQFPWAYDYGTGEYLGEGLDLGYFDFGGSYGPTFESSAGQGSAYGVDNMVGDFELLDYTGVDSCDDTTWPADFNGWYYINATGDMSQTVMPMPHKGDQAVQVRAFIGSTLPTSRLHLNVTACSDFVGTFFGWGVNNFRTDIPAPVGNIEFALDSGIVVERAPVFALGSVSVSAPGEIFTSLARTQTISATFYARDGAPASNTEVFLLRGAGTGARNVLGAFGGTLVTDANGQVSRSVTVPLLSLSQPHFFSFLTADERYAYGGREQMFGGLFGRSYYLNQFLFAPLAKIPMEFTRGYLFVPSTVGFASATVDRTLVPEGGTASVTVKVVTGTDTPIPNATVWSGPNQVVTDENGEATFNFPAALGATESLAVATTPDGQVIRAWFGVLASGPVLEYQTITVAPAPAGQASRVTVTVHNLLPVAGTATVQLLVDGTAQAAKVVSVAADGTATVTFDYVFGAAGNYQVTVGTQSTTAAVPAAPGPDLVSSLGLGVGLLVVGLAVGAVVGILLGRRGKKPPMMEEQKGEELGPEL
jgi:ABC-type transport system substrate-binding protein